jgi:hypothetical protein
MSLLAGAIAIAMLRWRGSVARAGAAALRAE